MEDVRPDPSFLKKLKMMDRRLGTKFNGKHFVVTYDRGYGEPVNVHRVKMDNGGFRQPDNRDLEFIKSGDLTNKGIKERLNELSYHSASIREKMREQAKSEIRDMTKDNKRQLINAVLKKDNARKANSTFRRITPKKKILQTEEQSFV
jgi:hypothetical protein